MGAFILFTAASMTAATPSDVRCGWLDNPTPGNWSLIDRDGEWLIGEQGGYQSPGSDNMPDMATRGWVSTNNHYGYGCACMKVRTNRAARRVTYILSASPRPLRQCRVDRHLPRR